MKSNKYFWASFVSGLVVIIGLVGLSIKGFYPAYQEFLQLCGLSSGTCQQVLQSISPMNIFAVSVLVWMGIVFSWQLLKTYLLVRQVSYRELEVPSFLHNITYRIGIGGKVKVVNGAVLFCSGLLKPQVVIGRDILNALSKKELQAALTHESYHLKNRDPLKVYLSTSISKTLFFLPAVGALSNLYIKEKELAADRLAEEKLGRVYLAKALYKVLERSNPNPAILPSLVPSFASISSIRTIPTLSSIPSWTWVGSIFILTFLFVGTFNSSHVLAGGCQ